MCRYIYEIISQNYKYIYQCCVWYIDTTMYRHRDLTIRVHRLKCLTPIFNLAAEEHYWVAWYKETFSPNQSNTLEQYRNILCYLSLSSWQPCAHTLSPLRINTLAFWKHRLACGSAISTSILFIIHNNQVFTYDREREREMLCMYELPP